jgi:hypothetical protein
MAETKQNASERLIASVSNAIEGALEPFKTAITSDIEDLKQTVNTMLARLETMSSLTGGKKAVKTERKSGSKSKSADGQFDPSKIKSNMMYFKMKYSTDDAFRAEHTDESAQAAIDNKNYKNKEGEELYKAQATDVWKTLSEDVKLQMKSDLAAWQEEQARTGGDEQIDETEDAPEADADAVTDADTADGAADGTGDGEEAAEEPPPKPKKAAKPAAKGAAKPAAKGAAKPAAKGAAKPAAKGAAKPAAKGAAKRAVKTTS